MTNQRNLQLTEKEKFLLNELNDLINKDVEQFIIEKIGIENPSYYQKRQFINSLLSQINENNISKLKSTNFFNKIIESTKHFTENHYSKLLKEENDKKEEINENNINSNDNKILEKLTSIDDDVSFIEKIKEKDEKIPLIFYNIKNNQFIEISMSKDYYIGERDNRYYYLSKLKEIFNLENPISEKEKNESNSELESLDKILGEEYVLTVDNFRKMVKIYYRLISNINLIIMGETGCGKTLLISKLYELLNNGEKINSDYKINIHGGFTDEDIIKKIEKINNEINQKENLDNKKIWVFIDEINTCKSMGLFSEIICNHSCNGKKLNNNLVFIGACNPYRKSKNAQKINGLIYNNHKNQTITLYNVNPLSHSLMNFVYYFGSLSKEDEEKYIKAIIEDIFNENEEELKDVSTKILCEGHTYVKNNGDSSLVSLREINRFKMCFKFFQNYYENKKIVLNENDIQNDQTIIKKKSIILSLYTCYYLKISDNRLRSQFNNQIKNKDNDPNDIMTSYIPEKDKIEKNFQFSSILESEEKFILSQIDLENGIAENRPLRDNLFLLFVSINLNIPIFIIGKPGCSKTLSVNLIDRAMTGKYSKKKFFRKYPALFKTWFQGTDTTTPQEVENLFITAENKVNKSNSNKSLEFYGQHPISLILFDEIGLCEISDKKPLKVLNFKLESETSVIKEEKEKKYLSFIGISNWTLDASKMNRGFTLSVPELHDSLDDLEETCKEIVKSINKDLWNEQKKYMKIFKALYHAYHEYKKKVDVKEAMNPLCHGSRDFYFLIKNVAFSFNDLLKKKIEYNVKDEIKIVTCAIERNFDGLHLENNIESTQLFKQLYIEERFKEDVREKEFANFETNKKDVIGNIISNIYDKNSRNLILITKSSLNLLLVETLLKKLEEINKKNKIKPIFKIGSSFEDDKGEEYKLKIINQIQEHAKNGDLLILQKPSNVFPSLFELFNLNYLKQNGKNYARISVGKSREQFIEINENFKVILLFDKDEIKNILQPLASRFEKIEIDFSDLLKEEEISRAISIEKTINKLIQIKLSKDKQLNYDLNSLIINLDLEEIQSMIYYCKNNNLTDEKKYIYEKIIPALP